MYRTVVNIQTGEVTQVELTDEEIAQAELQSVVTPEQVQSQIVSATQARLDDFAKTRNYDGILSACTYATSSNPKFASEGQYCVEARDATWAELYEIYDDVKAGDRPVPQGYDDIKAALPVLEWPDA